MFIPIVHSKPPSATGKKLHRICRANVAIMPRCWTCVGMEASVPMPFLSINATSSLSFLKHAQVEVDRLGDFGCDISVLDA